MSFEDRTKTFENWLKTNQFKTSPKIKISDLREKNQGRCIIALEDIEENEELFSIPHSKILNLKNGDLYQSRLTSDLKSKLEELNDWESLILTIMWEWKVLKTKSAWLDYFNVLPLNDPSYSFNHLMVWTDVELKSLNPSSILGRIGKEEAKEMYERLFTETVEDLGIKNEMGDIAYDDYLKVASVIMSYSFDVEDENNLNGDEEDEEDEEDEVEDKLIKSMVPLADTLNADSNLCNANLTYSKSYLTMIATSKIAKGEQIYNTYSDHPNAEILRRYGYVELNGSKNDFGEVTLANIKESFSEQIPTIDEFIEYIHDEIDLDEIEEGIELLSEAYECYSSGEVIPEFILLVQFLVTISSVNSVEPVSFGDPSSIKRILKKCLQLIESGKLTKGFIAQYKKILELRLGEYDLESTSEIGDGSSRRSMAKIVLKSESSSLTNCLDVNKVFESFKIIDDDKLLRNIVKKRVGEEQSGNKKRFKK
ncbi:ribosomal lysine N-methyltransferase 4 [[Candida] railenensis]|uniref:Ribosomal lysine N-methyltransferase 4 n=1 Tax=[Candida] railenensis TaxID=45579 RepID=A0A9P0VXA5_9ASCO|nr:ribosomal lysine N-methyltransferase 4 [[Candida] railenensis]